MQTPVIRGHLLTHYWAVFNIFFIKLFNFMGFIWIAYPNKNVRTPFQCDRYWEWIFQVKKITVFAFKRLLFRNIQEVDCSPQKMKAAYLKIIKNFNSEVEGRREKEREDCCIWTLTASPLYCMSSNFPKKGGLGKSRRYLAYTPQSHPLSLISSFHWLELNLWEEEKDILPFKIHAYYPVTPLATTF